MGIRKLKDLGIEGLGNRIIVIGQWSMVNGQW